MVEEERTGISYVKSTHPQVNRGRWWLVRRELAFLMLSPPILRSTEAGEERTGISYVKSTHPQVNRGRWWLVRRELAFLMLSPPILRSTEAGGGR